jgi:Holliday junction resolvase RusA-like endonuclease
MKDIVAVHLWLYYTSQRPDLDESLILDLMQGRVYANDRQVKEKHIYHGIDKTSPRSEVLVAPMASRRCQGDGRCLLQRLARVGPCPGMAENT